MMTDESNIPNEGPLDDADVIDTELQHVDLESKIDNTDSVFKIDSLLKGGLQIDGDKRPSKRRCLYNAIAVVIGMAMLIGLIVTIKSGKSEEQAVSGAKKTSDDQGKQTESDSTNSKDTMSCFVTTSVCQEGSKITSWTPMPDEIVGEAQFGQTGHATAISCDGSKMAVSSPRSRNEFGHVSVYSWNDQSSTWTSLGADINGTNPFDVFGYALAMSADGSLVAIGSEGEDNEGHVRVFQFVDSSWVEIGQQLKGEAVNDEAGSSVSLSSDGMRLAVGAPSNNMNMTKAGAGHVRVYELDKNVSPIQWKQLGKDIDGEAVGDQFGRSVALSGDGRRVAIGGFRNDGSIMESDPGHVRVFELDATSSQWNLVASEINGVVDEWLGIAVSMSYDGSIVAAGAPGGKNTYEGKARVFKLDNGKWDQMGSDLPGGGRSIAITSDGYRVVTGSYTGFFDSGHTVVYDFNGTDWSQIGGALNGMEGDRMGSSVAISADGKRVVASSPKATVDGQSLIGRVQVFDLC